MFVSRRAASVGARHMLRHPVATTFAPFRVYSSSSEAASQPQQQQPQSSSPPPPAGTAAKSSPSSYSSSSTPKSSTKSTSGTSVRAPTNGVANNGKDKLPNTVIYDPKTIGAHPSDAPEPNSATLEAWMVKGQGWSQGFYGIAERPVNAAQFEVLSKPIETPDIEVKPDGIIYLPEVKFRRRLNEAFGPMGWGMIPRGEAIVGDTVVTREYALIVNGRFVSQAQGENTYFSTDAIPAAVEGCKSNALMRCCKDLGIASQLWDPQFIRWFKKTHMESVWVEHVVNKKRRTMWFKKGQVDLAYPYKFSASSK